MLVIDHTDIARRAFEVAALPPKPRAKGDALRYLTILLPMLPIGTTADGTEMAPGWCKSPPGGENSLELPTGELVRIARVCYPDGTIYKVMNDVPNGGPQWVFDDEQPKLYLPYTGPSAPPAGDVVLPPPAADGLAALAARIEAIDERHTSLHEALRDQLTTVNRQIAELSSRPGPLVPPTGDAQMNWTAIGRVLLGTLPAALQLIERLRHSSTGREKETALIDMLVEQLAGLRLQNGGEAMQNVRVQQAIREAARALVSLQNVIARENVVASPQADGAGL